MNVLRDTTTGKSPHGRSELATVIGCCSFGEIDASVTKNVASPGDKIVSMSLLCLWGSMFESILRHYTEKLLGCKMPATTFVSTTLTRVTGTSISVHL